MCVWIATHILRAPHWRMGQAEPEATSFAENIHIKQSVPIYMQAVLFLAIATIYFAWGIWTYRKEPLRANGIIFILLGCSSICLWFYTGMYVLSNDGTALLDQVSIWFGLSSGVQAILFISAAIAFVYWGIWTIKRKSNKSSEPILKTPVD